MTGKRGGSRGAGRSRHRAREAALQILYEWEVGGVAIEDAIDTYWVIDPRDDGPPSDAMREFASSLVRGTAAHLAEVDPLIVAGAEHWRLERMAIVDRLILRLAVYEFLHASEIPRTVVIDEALELAKTFSTDEAVKFVNGILDGIKRRLDSATGDEQ